MTLQKMETLDPKEVNALKARLSKAAAEAVTQIGDLEKICGELDNIINNLMSLKTKLRFSQQDFIVVRDFMDKQIRYDQLLAERAYKNEELQAKVAEFAGYAALAIEQYSQKKDTSVKIRFRRTASDITNAIESSGFNLHFPAAKGILAPYIVSTRCAEDPADFATFRVYIRRLCSM